MEFFKCKSVIVLIIMLLSVSYISVMDDAVIQNHSQNNGKKVVENA